jgi:hypothetical protein
VSLVDAEPVAATPSLSSRRRSSATAAVILTCVALLPFVVAIATRAEHRYVPVGDIALMDLRVRDVWSSDIPLVGAYSRFGWNHPGPAAYYLLAPVNGLFGTPAWATLVANALVQGIAVALIALVAWRAGGLALLLASLALVGLAYGALGTDVVLGAWNPDVAYPLFPLFVLFAWMLAIGRPRALIGVTVVATILVQAHVGYLPLVVAGGVCALAFGLAHAGRHDRDTWARPLQWSLVAFVLLWIPTVVNELVHPSNVRALRRGLLHPHEPALGPRLSARVLAEEFKVLPPWLGGSHALDPFSNTVTGATAAWLVMPIVLLAGAALATRARKRSGSRELLVLAVTLAVAGFIGIARVTGPAERYVFYWRVPLALLIVFVSMWTFWIALDADRFPWARRAAGGVLAAIVLIASLTLSYRVATTDRVSEPERVARSAIAATTSEIAASRGVIVRPGDTPFVGVERALVNEFDRKDLPVKVDENAGFQFGYSRTARPEEVDQVWYVVENGASFSMLAAAPGARVLWNSSPLSTSEEHELEVAQRDLWTVMQRAGRTDLFFRLQSPLVALVVAGIPGVDRARVDRVAELNARVEKRALCRCAIVAFDPTHAAAAAALIPPEP